MGRSSALAAAELDDADPLAFALQRFHKPQGIIYLDGNSLGALPSATPAALAVVAEQQWGVDLISSWNKHAWIEWPARIAAKLAPIVGADTTELVIADSTSVSLFKLLCAAVQARPGRRVILTERSNFPTDLYIADGVAAMLGLEVRSVDRDDLLSSLDARVGAVMLTHVNYRSAAIHDMAKINHAAHDAGALTLWDLSHSAGAVEVGLRATAADLAVGCGYKYLNGGPGAPAFIYVARSLQEELQNPLPGWMGHEEPFAFHAGYLPAKSISRFQTGTAPILALAALEAGIDTFNGIRIKDVAAKSRSLSNLFINEAEARCGDTITLASPRDGAARGSHIVFAHQNGYAVIQALIARNIIGDFRAPDLMRFGFAALYNTHSDVVLAAEALAAILETGEWDQPKFKERLKVT